nr:uncharacterized protein C20orf173 homolog isoform X2 [Equus asinus]
MKHLWQIFVLWVFWVFILWLMASCLDQKPESAPREKLMYLVPRPCNCSWFKFRKCGCPSGTLNSSLYHPTVREWNWFDTCYGKMMGYLKGATESMTSDAVLQWLGTNSASELDKVWKKLFKVIPRPSASHFDLYCGTCVLGNLKILQASSLHNNVNQHTAVCRMYQAPVQGFKTVGNQTMGRFIYRRNVGDQGSWRQLVLLVLKLFDLAWTSDALSEEDARFGF